MNRAIWYVVLLALAAGCGKSPPEKRMDTSAPPADAPAAERVDEATSHPAVFPDLAPASEPVGGVTSPSPPPPPNK